jgi:thiamine-monophosphate kinase
MPSAPDPDAGPDEGEFGWIKRLLRPLTRGHPAALDLLDDAAVITPRAGHDLVVTKDAMVAGVHFLADDPLDTVAAKLLAVNLSDLAAKGAAPLGYFLSVAWPTGTAWADKVLFAEGLKVAGERWSLPLFGGDTVSTPGPLTLTATLLGEVPTGQMVRRATARPGDVLMVSGVIGDGWLGLLAARGDLPDPDGALAARYRTPEPCLALAEVLRRRARASADVSDGLLADAGRIAIASGCAVQVELEAMPVSAGGRRWLAAQDDPALARLRLATGGDDYEIVCAVDPAQVEAMAAAAGRVGLAMTPVGRFAAGQGAGATFQGRPVATGRLGWIH